MKIDVKVAKELAAHVVTSGSIGLVVGSIMGAISFQSKLNFEQKVSKLKGDITSLKTDPDFLDTVLALYPYRGVDPPRSTALFDKMLRFCNNIVQCHLQLHSSVSTTPGVFQFSMNRYFVQLRDASTAMRRLCERKASELNALDHEQGGLLVAYETSAEPMLQCADTYVHNSMMHDAYVV